MKYPSIDGVDRDDLIDSMLDLCNQLRAAENLRKETEHEIETLRAQIKEVQHNMTGLDLHTLDGARMLLKLPHHGIY